MKMKHLNLARAVFAGCGNGVLIGAKITGVLHLSWGWTLFPLWGAIIIMLIGHICSEEDGI